MATFHKMLYILMYILVRVCPQKAHSSGEDEAECSEKDDAEGLSVCNSVTNGLMLCFYVIGCVTGMLSVP